MEHNDHGDKIIATRTAYAHHLASDIMGDIRSSILDEVDFRKEADHLQVI